MLTAHDCGIHPSTYYAFKKRLPSARSVRDAELTALIENIHEINYGVYGVRKVWAELKRRGHTDVARCTVARLMRDAGLSGAVRGRKGRTTEPDPTAARPPDLLRRAFVATAPNRVWVADFTHVAAWAGTVYVAFVVDTFSRRVVGWSAATNKRTDLVLSAFEMGLWQRDRAQYPVRQGELIHHSDAGSQGGFNRSSQHFNNGGVDGQAGGVDAGVDGQGGDEVAGEALTAS